MAQRNTFPRVRYWIREYAQSGIEDRRAIENFVECESREMISPFRAQLHSISKGNFEERLLDRIVGKKRKIRHGSYQQWAKLALMWLAEYKDR